MIVWEGRSEIKDTGLMVNEKTVRLLRFWHLGFVFSLEGVAISVLNLKEIQRFQHICA